MVLVIRRTEWNAIRRHGENAYPNECCGVLVGRINGNGRTTVHAAVACRNSREPAGTRYEIDPAELFRIQRECRNTDHEIVGFYHSHPDHQAEWSATDLNEAHWTGCSYVITSVERGRAAATNSFVLLGNAAENVAKRFHPQEIEIV